MDCLAGALARYADRPRTQSARANGALSASDESGLPVTTDRARTYWHVQHPELVVHLVVAARTDDEARTLAWRRWYRLTSRWIHTLRSGSCLIGQDFPLTEGAQRV